MIAAQQTSVARARPALVAALDGAGVLHHALGEVCARLWRHSKGARNCNAAARCVARAGRCCKNARSSSAATGAVRATLPAGLNWLRCVLSPSSGSKLAVCTARLPQHCAQLSHDLLQALWLARPGSDVSASQAHEAHLDLAALASELGVPVARGAGV